MGFDACRGSTSDLLLLKLDVEFALKEEKEYVDRGRKRTGMGETIAEIVMSIMGRAIG